MPVCDHRYTLAAEGTSEMNVYVHAVLGPLCHLLLTFAFPAGDPDAWSVVLRVNLETPMRLVHGLAPHMVRAGFLVALLGLGLGS